jgi:hypothetical protein
MYSTETVQYSSTVRTGQEVDYMHHEPGGTPEKQPQKSDEQHLWRHERSQLPERPRKEVLGKSTALAAAAAAAATAHVKHKALSPTTTKAVEAHTATAASRGHVKILAEELAEDLFRIRMTVRTDSASAAFPPGAVVECALVLVA